LRIVEDGHRASSVIAQIRSFAHQDKEDQVPVSLNETILEVARLLQFEVTAAQATLRLVLDHDLPPIQGHRIQLQYMVLNLMRNALDATSAQPRREIIVTTGRDGASARLRIEDSGVGLDTGPLDRIFEPFHTTKPGSMGIGLSLCRTVVEAHHGRIWAEPNANGAGSTFHCELPFE
jgi:signal transduction histidine kinase